MTKPGIPALAKPGRLSGGIALAEPTASHPGTVIVVGSGTDVGKTYVTCRLVQRLVADGATVRVKKPVVSGFDATSADSDPRLLLAAAGRPPSDLDDVSPFRFAAPVSPDRAARAEGRTVRFSDIVSACRPSDDGAWLVIEAAGGVMSPLCEDATVLDLVEQLAAPVLMVVGAYLGAISHGLTAYEALMSRGADVRAVIVNRTSDDVDVEPFRRFLPRAHVLALPNHADSDHPSIAAAVARLLPAHPGSTLPNATHRNRAADTT